MLTPGTGGNGGGGDGGATNPTNGTPGTANTGGGGGGGGYDTGFRTGGNGGSGVVIIRASAASLVFSSGVTCNNTSGGGTISGVSISTDYIYIITETTSSSETVTF